jgi:hypothetical protein
MKEANSIHLLYSNQLMRFWCIRTQVTRCGHSITVQSLRVSLCCSSKQEIGMTSSSCNSNLEYAQHSPDRTHPTLQCHDCSCASRSPDLIEVAVGHKELGIQLLLPTGAHPCNTNSTKQLMNMWGWGVLHKHQILVVSHTLSPISKDDILECI